MNPPSFVKLSRRIAAAVLAGTCLAAPPTLQAETWVGGLLGDWSLGANWNNGTVPSGNVAEVINGSALISNTVPAVAEAWAGNNGIVGNIIVTNGGTLPVTGWLVAGRMAGAQTETPFSRIVIHNGTVNKGGDGLIIGDNGNGLFSEGEIVVAGTGVLNVTGGWFGIGNGNGSKGTVRLRDSAVVNNNGQDFNVGDYGASQGFFYLQDSATLNVSRFWIGKGDSSFGRLLQTGGAIVGTGPNANEWCLGGQDGGHTESFGYYGLSAGTFNNPFNFQIGRNGRGVIYQTGGSITAGSWTALGRFAAGYGVVWVSGGTFSHVGATTQLLVAENGRGEFNLSGTGALDTNLRLRLGNLGGTGVVNFNGGTASVPGFEQGGSGYLNFNGSTIRAKASTATFMNGLVEARVYAGNAIFDTASNNITIGQALLDGAGQGVLSIPIVDGGVGHQAPPIVQITGDGFGATALAQIDFAAGTVTNIIITCPGYGYSSAIAVTLGGGASSPATLGNANIGAVAGGGVVKIGLGALVLSGLNTFTGPMTANEGKLIVSTDSAGSGFATVADNAGFGVVVNNANAQLTIPNVGLGSTVGASLDFDLAAFGNPTAAPLNVSGTLTVNGVITVNVAAGLPQVGAVPLVQYNTRAGSGTFVIGTLPAGVQAGITTNTVNKTIDLVINSVGLPRWEGLAGGNWDINLTTNWIEQSTGLPTRYTDGAPVLFDDQALGTTTVNLVTTVSPTGVNITNSILDYTLVGSGKISGTSGLTKRGTTTFTIANAANEYTGATVISGGTLAVTNLANGGSPSAIGRSSSAANNLTLAGGTLSYGGPAISIDRGYSVQGAGSTIDTVNALTLSGAVTATTGSGFRKAGPGQLTYRGAGVKELSGGGFPGYNVVNGTVLFDGSGVGQTNHSQNEFWVGGTPDTGANLVLSNTVLNIDSWFAIGRGNGTLGNVSTTTLYDSRLRSGALSMGYDNQIAGNLAHSILTLNGSSTFTNTGDGNFGESTGSLTEIFLNGNSVFFGNNRFHIGWHNGATGNVVIAQSALLHANAWFSIGHEGGEGSVLVKDNARLYVGGDANVTDVNTGTGLLTIQDNASLSANQVFIGKGVGSVGTLNQTGGTVVARGGAEFHIGARGEGTYNLIAGTVDANTQWTSVGRFPGAIGTLNVSGGIFRHNDAGKLLMVGEEGTGTLNVSGTGVVSSVGERLSIGQSGGAGIVNLNGGTIRVRRVGKNNGTGAFNFNGGVLEAGPNALADFMSGLDTVTVLAGGAVINSAGQNIGINQVLIDGGGNGGLTKQGAGALYLNGVNTYTGPTLVNAGTLGGSGTVVGSVTIGAAASLAPGTSIGTFTVGASLTLGSNTVMEVSRDGDVATSDLAVATGNLAFGGALTVVVTGTNALAVNDTFNLFDWGTRSGSFTSTSLPSGYTWDVSQLTVDGTIRVTGIVNTPTINQPFVSGGNLVFTGTGGTPGGSYTVLTATNIALPSAQWTTNTTGAFNGSGAFSNALPVSTTEAARFYRLRVP